MASVMSQDLLPYYRAMDTLEDTPVMEGNCKDAQPGFGKNEMYPCIDQNVTYGLAVTGLAIMQDSSSVLASASAPASASSVPLLKTSLTVDTVEEPDVRQNEKPIALHGVVEVTGLSAYSSTATFALYRFGSTAAVPTASADLETSDYDHRTAFAASDATVGGVWTFEDPDSFESNSATYYVASLVSS